MITTEVATKFYGERDILVDKPPYFLGFRARCRNWLLPRADC